MERITCHNSTYPKVAVQWLNQALCFYQNLCLVDSEVLRKPARTQSVGTLWAILLKHLSLIKGSYKYWNFTKLNSK